LDAQRSGAQMVPTAYLRQPPAPSQRPSVPQVAAPLSTQVARGSAAPAGTAAHLPIDDGSAQLLHAPAQASAQHTPSTQNVLPHSDPLAQVWPFAFGPQLPATQVWPVWHWESVVHLSMHAPAAQRNGVHTCTFGGWQTPLPSQVPAVSRRSPTQAGAVHTVSAP
jgi:hypothetical protein